MKTIILLASLLSLSNVFAASVNDSWETLNKDYSLDIEWPAAQMTHGVWTGVDFLCLDGNTIRTKKVLDICTKYATKPGKGGGKIICAASKKAFGIVNNEVTGTRCVEYRHSKEQDVCVKYEDYSYPQPTSFEVDVNKIVNKDGLTRHLFTKDYSITACE